MLRRALLVGIDTYDHYASLDGCINDVVSIQPLLKRDEDDTPTFSCVTRRSDLDRVTRDSLLEDLDALLASGSDVALFYFAGHGMRQDADVSLVTQDGMGRTPGVGLSEVFTAINRSSVKEVLVIMDACFAGAAGQAPQLNLDLSLLRDGVSVLAASRGDQTSAESAAGRGMFSTYLEGALDGGAADALGNVNIAGIYAYIAEAFNAWEQRPTFKANIDRLHVLRKVEPAVPLAVLRKLPHYFPSKSYEYALDPSFEFTDPSANPDHVEVLQVFQKLRAARLLEPVDEDHLYFAAMNQTACRLTRLGHHYWLLATLDRI